MTHTFLKEFELEIGIFEYSKFQILFRNNSVVTT